MASNAENISIWLRHHDCGDIMTATVMVWTSVFAEHLGAILVENIKSGSVLAAEQADKINHASDIICWAML